MATELTLEGYLDNNSRVKAARKKLETAGKKLDAAKKALNSARNASPDVVKDIKASIESARAEYNSTKTETSVIENEITNDFKKNYKSISTKANQGSLTELQAALPKAKSVEEYKAIQDSINKIQSKIANPQEYTEPILKKRTNQNGQTPSNAGGGTGLQVEDFASTLKGARNELKKMSDSDRLILAQGLKDAGYNVPLTGVFTDALLDVYQTAISAAQSAYNANKEFSTLDAFLADRKAQVAAINAAGGGSGSSSFEKTISISAPTEARAIIQQQFQSILGRDATEEELAKYTEKLNVAEKKNASIARGYSTSTGKGSSKSTTYTGGLDKVEFLAEQIKKIPEYAQKKEEKASLTSQTIQKTINANGLNLPADQVAAWTKAVESGTKLDVVLNQIRQIASVGMPDNVKKLLNEGTDLSTIYSPYKQTMAATLELDPNAINLNDPILRSAIGPNGEMPIYDFQRQLRKDARWQYTNNARKEVSDSVSKVLQDFGFMG